MFKIVIGLGAAALIVWATQQSSSASTTDLLNGTSATAKTSKKLIEFGWDKPTPAQVSTAELENSVFDGVVFGSSAGDRTFTKTLLPKANLDADITAFNAIKSDKLANSFYDVQTYASQDWDWFDDATWATSLQNLGQAARVAKRAGLRGIMFDAETYEFNIWDYHTQARAKSLSFPQYEAKLRERGAQTMRTLEQEFPGLSFFALWWLSNTESDFAAAKAKPDPYAELHKQLEQVNTGLWVAFVEGMVEAASNKVRFIDGNEGSYYHLYAKDFDHSKAQTAEHRLLVRPDLRSKYAQLVRFGNAIYLDGVLNLHKSARFAGFYFTSDAERQNYLASNTFHALRTSEEFVWAYGENMNWWESKVPTGLEATLRRAKNEYISGKPLSNDPTNAIKAAEVAYKARVDVGGDMTGTSGRKPDFGAMNPHCATWSNASRYSCTQPSGSSFTVTPTLEGVKFDPPSRTYTNLTKSSWYEHFKVK